jgi:hypothetical protein
LFFGSDPEHAEGAPGSLFDRAERGDFGAEDCFHLLGGDVVTLRHAESAEFLAMKFNREAAAAQRLVADGKSLEEGVQSGGERRIGGARCRWNSSRRYGYRR